MMAPPTITENTPPSALVAPVVCADQSKSTTYWAPATSERLWVISTPRSTPGSPTAWPTENLAAFEAASGPGPSMSMGVTLPGAPAPLAVFTTVQPERVPVLKPPLVNDWASAGVGIPAHRPAKRHNCWVRHIV